MICVRDSLVRIIEKYAPPHKRDVSDITRYEIMVELTRELRSLKQQGVVTSYTSSVEPLPHYDSKMVLRFDIKKSSFLPSNDECLPVDAIGNFYTHKTINNMVFHFVFKDR